MKGVVCKLDIEKAYDYLNWQFLMEVMHCMGLGAKWRRWIWWCISTTRFSILVNDVLASFFPSSKGLGQKDPLSSYLVCHGYGSVILIHRAFEGGYLLSQRKRWGWLEYFTSPLRR